MLVKDVMTTNVRTARSDTRIRDVAILMCFHRISGLPVVDEDSAIVGVISEKDVLRAMYPKVDEALRLAQTPLFEELEAEYRDVLNLHVNDLMTKRVFTVAPTDPILRAVSVMFAHKIRRIPVADHGRLAGILSIGDVHKAIFKETFDREFGHGDAQLGDVQDKRLVSP
ncbi:CBS domain-containing protein [Acidiferrobacter sp.]|uniref:CBS domain-containing protein n=1 Tax=Acidiferrobacter sp. TaxID=1872107 RepID=UPI00262D81DC|nr:CBS domain-containing protein [Acidiferrobacter sp.]